MIAACQIDRSAFRSSCCALVISFPPTEILLALASNPQIPPETRHSAAWSLAELGHAEESKAFLGDLATDSELGHRVRYYAANTLGKVGYVQEAIPILEELAADPTVPDEVRCDAASVLAELGQLEKAISCIVYLASNKREDLLKEERTLVAGEISEEAIIFLQGVATDENLPGHLRHAALKALIALDRDENTTDVLLAMARDPEAPFWVRNTAYESLKRLVGM